MKNGYRHKFYNFLKERAFPLKTLLGKYINIYNSDEELRFVADRGTNLVTLIT